MSDIVLLRYNIENKNHINNESKILLRGDETSLRLQRTVGNTFIVSFDFCVLVSSKTLKPNLLVVDLVYIRKKSHYKIMKRIFF